MYHTPGVNNKIWGTRLIFSPCTEHCGFYGSSRFKLDQKTLRGGPTCRHTNNSVLFSSLCSLSNNICRHKRNVLLLRNVAWYSFPVPSVGNLLNQTYILTANVKFPPCQHTNTSYTNEIAIIHLQFPNSKHKTNVN